MNRKIFVINPRLTEDHREQIRRIALGGGYEVRFFASNKEALPEMENAAVCYGLGADLTEAGKNLEWFNSISAGVDPYLQEGKIANPGMVLTCSAGAYGVAVAEHALMLTLEILRRQPEYAEKTAEKEWFSGLSQRTIKNSTVTILGTGDLGSQVAKRMAGFAPAQIIGVNRSGKCGCRAFDRIVKQESVNEVLPETDILVMCLPGTNETRHFMDEKRIALLPKHAVLVNVGRGNAVDTAALTQALEEDRLWAAALDVFEQEPLPKDSPLWDCRKLLITTHVAGDLTAPYTVEKNFELFCENLEYYISGKPLKRVVDRLRGY